MLNYQSIRTSFILLIICPVFIYACADSIEQVSQDKVSPNTIAIPSGTYYKDKIEVSLSCKDDISCKATYYTIDGSTPQQTSAMLYNGPIMIDNTNPETVIKYFSVDFSGNADQGIKQAIYTLDAIKPTVTAQPPGGLFNKDLNVTLSCNDEKGSGCDTVYYALKDQEPMTDDYNIISSDNAIIQIKLQEPHVKLWYFASDAVANLSDKPLPEIYEFDISPPEVISTLPNSNTFDVGTLSTIDITFSEPLKNNSITNNSFKLVHNSVIVDSTISVNYTSNQQSATLTPNNGLSLLSFYNCILTKDILDLANNPLISEYNFNFLTRDGQWGPDGLIGSGSNPQVSGNNYGNSVVYWHNGPVEFITNKYSGSKLSDWSTTSLLARPTLEIKPQKFKVIYDGAQNVRAIWIADTSGIVTGPDVINTSYLPYNSQVFTVVQRVADNPGDGRGGTVSLENLNIATDHSGTGVIAIWSGGNSIYSARLNSTSNTIISSDVLNADLNASVISGLSLAVSTNGDLITIWQQNDTIGQTTPAIYVKILPGNNGFIDLDTPWNTIIPNRLSQVDVFGQNPKIALDNKGNAIAIWVTSSGEILAQRYINNGVTGWLNAETISKATFQNITPDIAIDENGNVLVIWSESNNISGNNEIWTNHLPTGWQTVPSAIVWDISTAELISDSTNDASSPSVKFDSSGHATAIWVTMMTLSDGTNKYEIVAHRLVSGWVNKTTPIWEASNRKILASDVSSSSAPTMSVDFTGKVTVTWVKNNTNGTLPDIKFARFE